MDLESFADKGVVVLGASAKGSIGERTARAFREKGARVLIAARREPEVRAMAAEIGGLAFACDGGTLSGIEGLAQAARRELGHIDYAVNCVGLPAPGAIADVTEDDLDRLVRLNFSTNVFFLRYMAEIMNDGGAITLVSALTADRPVLPNALYSCTKAASECLVKYGALEFGSRGIRVNSVIPGFTASDFTSSILNVEGVAEAFAREIPLQRIGEADDIAKAILALSALDYVTGVNLHVSGGNQLTRLPRMEELPRALFAP